MTTTVHQLDWITGPSIGHCPWDTTDDEPPTYPWDTTENLGEPDGKQLNGAATDVFYWNILKMWTPDSDAYPWDTTFGGTPISFRTWILVTQPNLHWSQLLLPNHPPLGTNLLGSSFSNNIKAFNRSWNIRTTKERGIYGYIGR